MRIGALARARNAAPPPHPLADVRIPGLRDAPLWTILLALALTAAAAAPASADVVHLRNGGQLEGTVSESGSEVIVELRPGMAVRIPRGDVLEIELKATAEDLIEKRLGELKSYDANGFYELALEAQEAGLPVVAEKALREVIRIDPDHAGARALLGQVQVDGEWIDHDEAQRRAGKVELGRRWVTEEEKAELERRDHARDVRGQVRQMLRDARRVRDPEQAGALWTELIGLAPDPAAGRALRQALAGAAAVEMRRLAAGVLRAWPGEETETDLIDAALSDDDDATREMAGASLHALRSREAGRRFFEVFVGSRSDERRRRAADGLVALRSRETVEPLIYALYERQTVRRDVPIRGRSRGDPDSYFMGLVRMESRKVTDFRFNRLARDALISMTGQNYDYAKGDWLDWWEQARDSYDPFMDPVAADDEEKSEAGSGARKPRRTLDDDEETAAGADPGERP